MRPYYKYIIIGLGTMAGALILQALNLFGVLPPRLHGALAIALAVNVLYHCHQLLKKQHDKTIQP